MPLVGRQKNGKLKFAGRKIQVLHYQEALELPGKQDSGRAGGGTYVSLLSTTTLLTAELFAVVDTVVHLNWFQASAPYFSYQSAEISAQSSVSMTAKH